MFRLIWWLILITILLLPGFSYAQRCSSRGRQQQMQSSYVQPAQFYGGQSAQFYGGQPMNCSNGSCSQPTQFYGTQTSQFYGTQTSQFYGGQSAQFYGSNSGGRRLLGGRLCKGCK